MYKSFFKPRTSDLFTDVRHTSICVQTPKIVLLRHSLQHIQHFQIHILLSLSPGHLSSNAYKFGKNNTVEIYRKI